MIKSVLLENFKSFVKADFALSELTILTGLNSSGKSSVIQALRMLFLSSKSRSPYIKGFGGYDELRSKFSLSSASIKIRVCQENGDVFGLTISDSTFQVEGALDSGCNIDYVGADRLGPSSILPTISSESDFICVGDKGQYSVDYYLHFENILVNKKLQHPSTSSLTLQHQLEKWMGEITPGVSLSFGKEEKHDISHLEIDKHRAANTGFGISYSLPIVLAALVMSSKQEGALIPSHEALTWFRQNKEHTPILLIENPEAHLHPRGQTAMGRLLALAASCGLQIVVETHSDHFLDGVRLQVKAGEIKPSNVKMYFFERDTLGETSKKEITIQQNGKLDAWPKGFFDQSMINLQQLAK